MRRTVRNGLAIAGMVGGFFILGQAVASADDGQTAGADSGTEVVQESTSTSGEGAGNINGSNNQSDASNSTTTTADTDVAGGNGGTNEASVNTGVIEGGGTMENSGPQGQELPDLTSLETPAPPSGGTEVEIETGDVKVVQEANGGDVKGSGNANVSGAPTQTATSTATTSVDQTAKNKGGSDGGDPESYSTSSMGGDGAGNYNDSNNQSSANNSNTTDVDTNVTGGNGGTNWVEINTGLIGVTFNCPEGSTCYFNIDTGDVYVHQEANGGDVTDSGNVNIGGKDKDKDKDRDKPGHKPGDKPGDKDEDCPKEAPAPPKTIAPVQHRAPVLSSEQPTGELAFTGATDDNTALVLTLGLLALGAGGALTLAGRRRETATE